jgi:hypothetical protein
MLTAYWPDGNKRHLSGFDPPARPNIEPLAMTRNTARLWSSQARNRSNILEGRRSRQGSGGNPPRLDVADASFP